MKTKSSGSNKSTRVSGPVKASVTLIYSNNTKGPLFISLFKQLQWPISKAHTFDVLHGSRAQLFLVTGHI